MLRFFREGHELMRFPLGLTEVWVGRHAECDVVLPDADISRKHVSLQSTPLGWRLDDNSVNGTHLNDKPVDEAVLNSGDKIRIGAWSVVFEEGLVEEGETVALDHAPTTILSYDAAKGEITTQALKIRVKGSGTPVEKIFQQEVISVGKGAANDLVIDDPYVSGQHLKIIQRAGVCFVRDLGSTNGTFLGSKRIGESEIASGDELTLGKIRIIIETLKKVDRVAPAQTTSFARMIGGSAAMRQVFALLERVAPSDGNVCVIGETGTGKELVASACHDLSHRRKAPFVAINCGAISPNLIESELFGHEKGSFTGAVGQHKGAFEQAHNGTLFLDEIGELPLDLQPKLLRALESRQIRRVGGNQDIQVDVRIVVATNRDLAQSVRDGKFREDLFYRLFVIPVKLPPLRDRTEDIPLLVEHFIKEMSPPGRSTAVTEEAIEFLSRHPWRGNIRELKNVIGRTIILSGRDVIRPEDIVIQGLGGEDREENAPSLAHAPLEDAERRKILEILKQVRWNKRQAAKLLGIARSTLFLKLKKYNLEQV